MRMIGKWLRKQAGKSVDVQVRMHRPSHGRNLVGDTGNVSPPLFQMGEHNMPCPPTFFSLGFVFGGDSKIKMFVMFCVKRYSY